MVYLWYLPSTPHYCPFFLPAVAVFYTLDAYLHCGYGLTFVEWLFPKCLLNSSCFHNAHHEKVIRNFGEVTSLAGP